MWPRQVCRQVLLWPGGDVAELSDRKLVRAEWFQLDALGDSAWAAKTVMVGVEVWVDLAREPWKVSLGAYVLAPGSVHHLKASAAFGSEAREQAPWRTWSCAWL